MTTVLPGGPKALSEILTAREIRKTIQELTDGEKTAIMKIARLYALRTPYGHEDLFHEALCRLLEGTRAWPRGAPAVLVLAGIMRSVAWGWRRRRADDNPDNGVSCAEQEWVILLQDLISAFDGKPLLQHILIEMLKGTKGPELRDWIAALLQQKGLAAGTDVPQIDSLLRAIRRGVETFRAQTG
jgi:DNA-directed RNA polymerase specialized sigma24 family protein